MEGIRKKYIKSKGNIYGKEIYIQEEKTNHYSKKKKKDY